MLVRIEKIGKDKKYVSVIDENDVYIGDCYWPAFCKIAGERETTEIDDYDYYTVEKTLIKKICKL